MKKIVIRCFFTTLIIVTLIKVADILFLKNGLTIDQLARDGVFFFICVTFLTLLVEWFQSRQKK